MSLLVKLVLGLFYRFWLFSVYCVEEYEMFTYIAGLLTSLVNLKIPPPVAWKRGSASTVDTAILFNKFNWIEWDILFKLFSRMLELLINIFRVDKQCENYFSGLPTYPSSIFDQ